MLIPPLNQSPPRLDQFPYHLRAQVAKEIEKMVAQDVIEEHPPTEPAPWVSNAVTAPKSDGAICMTINARNVNKAVHASNLPIPRQEDMKAKLSGAKVFSKMDFKSAFWQLELHPGFQVPYGVPCK